MAVGYHVRMTKAVFLGDATRIDRVYAQGRRETVASLTDLYPVVLTRDTLAEHAASLTDVQVIWTTWGMSLLTAEHLAFLPSLRAVFYAAGSVQSFARPLLERGITVVSAWQANGVPVAEFVLAQILLAGKGYFRQFSHGRPPDTPQSEQGRAKGNFGETVAILGVGAIGRLLIDLLRPFRLRVLAFDPFLGDAEAMQLGVEKVSLEEAFTRGRVISNHLANNPQTVGLLDAALFRLMRDDATFINTGRGQTVREDDLIRELTTRPSLTALLDVTYPEPPLPDSPLYALPNIFLTPHIAGSIGDEVVRLADYCLEDFRAWQRGESLRYAVTLSMLDTMA